MGRRRRSASRPSIRVSLVILGALAMTACGGGQDAGAPAEADTAGSTAAAPASAPARNRCPLTGDQVSAVLGVQVAGPDTTCSFYPPGDDVTVRPNATYIPQVLFACSGSIPAEVGYSEKVDGLGTAAYIVDRMDGSTVLVCREGDPFEVQVDAADRDTARKAAVALARQVLAGQ